MGNIGEQIRRTPWLVMLGAEQVAFECKMGVFGDCRLEFGEDLFCLRGIAVQQIDRGQGPGLSHLHFAELGEEAG